MSRPELVPISFFAPATESMRQEVRVARLVLTLWALLAFGLPLGIWLAGRQDPAGLGASFLTQARFLGFPLHYWLIAQGGTVGFVLLCKLHDLLWRRWARARGGPR